MSRPDFEPIQPARVDWQEQTPAAPDFGDTYFSRGQGPAESEHVFLHGNQLPRRWESLRAGDTFTIGETGFGTGLNVLLATEWFSRLAPAGARLHFLSAEKHPLLRADLVRALEPLAVPPALYRRLLAGYPPPVAGFHRIRLAPAIDLTLMLGEATDVWELCNAPVDAWFLDGFAPARNPAMWQPALFERMARLSRPGTTLATFTAAGHVRRGLAQAGFAVSRQAGFGRKREMLAGVFPSNDSQGPQQQPGRIHTGHALIAGAGLAGATTARAMVERGWTVQVLDPDGIASGASGNRSGVVYTTPSPHLTPQNRFYQSSFLHARRWLDEYGFPAHDSQGQLNDVIQHFVDDRHAERIRAAMNTGAWPSALLSPEGGGAVRLHGGGYLDPGAWCRRLLDHPGIQVTTAGVARLLAGPAVECRDGHRLDADLVILCTAGATRHLPGLDWLPLKMIRGQVSYCRATPASGRWRTALCHAGYLTPAIDGMHCVGATFNLHEPSPEPRDEDDRANLDQLHRHLPDYWAELGGAGARVAEHRVGFRCQSRDFLPLCGPLPASPDPAADGSVSIRPGVFLNIAHGSRGITGTPLCAETLADLVSGLPLPVDTNLATALAPMRFVLRKLRRR